jgi:ribosomal subunit interface protein
MMNLDIETEHIAMRPEWHRIIDAWVEQCRHHHPKVVGIDVTLRHGDRRDSGEQVDAMATACGQTLRATRRAPAMTAALHDALDALEKEVMRAEVELHAHDAREAATASQR